MPEVLTKTDQLLQLLRRESATTTPALDRRVSFDERSDKIVTLAVESFGRLGREGSQFIDQLATSVVGGRGRGADADGMGLSHRCRVGNYKSWKEESKEKVGDFLPTFEWGRK